MLLDKEMDKLLSIFFFVLLLTLNGVMAYTYQIPLCNPPTINTSCISYTSIPQLANIPMNGIVFTRDGNLYLTNDSFINYSSSFYNITNITHYNLTNITYYYTNVTNITYIYNLTNGSTIIVNQNITANETTIRDWLNSRINSSYINATLYLNFYNRNDTDAKFATNTELNKLKTDFTTALTAYSTKTDLDAKYNYLLTLNSSGLNQTAINELNDTRFTLTWKIVLIVDCVLTVLLLIGLMRLTMSG